MLRLCLRYNKNDPDSKQRRYVMERSKELIEKLGLEPHPEGGYYKQVYKSPESIKEEYLPQRFGGERVYSTAIYFLLDRSTFSALHIINQDEIWHHYEGAPLEIVMINEEQEAKRVILGKDLEAGQKPMIVVPYGVYFGARPIEDEEDYSFVGCTVAPGFEFDDFILPAREELLRQYPHHSDIIHLFTRK